MEMTVSKRRVLVAAMVLAGAGALAGCRVHVDKDQKGEDKTVQVDTPFGGVHVNTNQTTAEDLGLPVYPGAVPRADDDHHKSANVHLGFGEWQLRVQVVSYESADGREKVEAFYKKALGRYGDVITCQGNTPVGTPTVTSQGLTCNDDNKNGKMNLNDNDWKGDLSLKAGSHHRQHIVGFEDGKDGKTRFSLVALDLPEKSEGDNGKD